MTFAERLAADATANAEALAALAELAPAAGGRGDRLVVAADLEVKAADRRGRFAVPGEVAAAVRSFLRRNPMPA